MGRLGSEETGRKAEINFSDFTDFCRDITAETGDIIRSHFRTALPTESKTDSSPVTIADRQCETAIRRRVREKFPDHGIIGEEFGEEKGSSSYTWIIDPIDGTVSFISGAQSFGTLIALVKDGQPLFGCFHQPILRELLVGDGSSALLYNDRNPEGSLCRVRPIRSLADATLLVTDSENVGKYRNRPAFDRLCSQVRYVRGWGDCYGYYLLATGFADIMIDPIMNVWDTMALLPIVRAAGGTITDYSGKDPVTGNSIVATHPSLHSQVIEILNS